MRDPGPRPKVTRKRGPKMGGDGATTMSEERPETGESASAGLLGAFGLSRGALLAVALIAVAVWWYFQSADQPLNTWETAVVVLALALLVTGARTVFGLLRRRAPTSGKPP